MSKVLSSSNPRAGNVVYNNQLNTYTAGRKQTFGADATNAGVNFAGVTADPSVLVDGDIWRRSDLGRLMYREGSVTKTIVSYVETSITSSATPTPTGDARENYLYITALSQPATFAAPSGTPANGNSLLIRIKDDGSTRNLSWNAIYRVSTDLSLPTVTVVSKTIYLKIIYNSASSTWDLLSVLNNF